MTSHGKIVVPEIADTLSESVSAEEFERVRKLVYAKFGINLTEQKRALVAGRLRSALNQYGYKNISEYLDWIEKGHGSEGLSDLVNRISTNYTHFFREKTHFDFFVSDVLPWALESLKKQGQNDLRIWCAASSSGEEPYSLQMQIMEHLGADYKNWNAGMLATDISERALSTAEAGIYPPERVAEIPQSMLAKWFTKLPDGNYKVVDALRKEITYRRFNLMNDVFPFKKPFHAVFIRNVMIYFDNETRERLIAKIYDKLVPGGYLFIGHSESLGSIKTPLKYVKPAVYQREGGG
jgi:chemotaxis protein methyltransferase CheR